MKSSPNQPQTPNDGPRGYAPQEPLDYYSVQDDGSQGGYQQDTYPPGQSYPPQYQQQHPYWIQQPSFMPTPGDVSPFEMTSMGMRARTAGLLCYLFSWVGGLIFLLLERENRFVRFHARQSILFFGTMTILESVFSYIPYGFFGIGGVLGLVTFIGWIVLMVSAYRGRYYKLPLFGDYAEKWANSMRV